MDTKFLDTRGVQGAQHNGSNDNSVPDHRESIRILTKFCGPDRLTHSECAFMHYIFSKSCNEQLVHTHVLAPIAIASVSDGFIERALQLLALLTDPSVNLINSAVEILDEDQIDWARKRSDGDGDFYSLREQYDGCLPLPPTHLPTNAHRSISETCAAQGCDESRHTGNSNTAGPFPYCGRTCATRTTEIMCADTSKHDGCKRPGCGRLVLIGLNRSVD